MNALDYIIQGLVTGNDQYSKFGFDKMNAYIDPVRVLSGNAGNRFYEPSLKDYIATALMGLGTRAPNTATLYRGARRPPKTPNPEGEIFFSDKKKIADEYTASRNMFDKAGLLHGEKVSGPKPRTWRAEVDTSGFLKKDLEGQLWPIIEDTLIPVARAKGQPGVVAKNVTDVGPGTDAMLQNQYVVLDPSKVNPINWKNMSLFGPGALSSILKGLAPGEAK